MNKAVVASWLQYGILFPAPFQDKFQLRIIAVFAISFNIATIVYWELLLWSNGGFPQGHYLLERITKQ